MDVCWFETSNLISPQIKVIDFPKRSPGRNPTLPMHRLCDILKALAVAAGVLVLVGHLTLLGLSLDPVPSSTGLPGWPPRRQDRGIRPSAAGEVVVVGPQGQGFERSPPDVWITMGLCWSGNTNVWGKDHFPYREAAPLSTRLWLEVIKVRVLLHVVYSEPEPPGPLLEYARKLEAVGCLVRLVKVAPGISCVLESQLIRILAFLLPEIPEEAVIVTSDVDAFPMTKEILAPLVVLRNRSIWLYRYGFTLGTGSTFMMPFIGARKGVWRRILHYDDGYYDPQVHPDIGQGLPAYIDRFRERMSFNENYTWEFDQFITSTSILSSGLCSLPANNSLWSSLKLDHITPKEFDDTETCWHGGGTYEDCNNRLTSRNTMIRLTAGNCKWWHFYPDETYADLVSKFKEIVGGRQESGVFNSLVHMMHQVKVKAG